MRFVEVRRHAPTGVGTGGFTELSDVGATLASEIGAATGPFVYSVASADPRRGAETAAAMGYPAHRLVDMTGGGALLSDAFDEMGGFHAWRDWAEPFVSFHEVVSQGAATARIAQHQVAIWERALDNVPDRGSALVISHGALIECALVSLFADEDVTSWGGTFWNLEGARLGYNGAWHLVGLLRLSPKQRDLLAGAMTAVLRSPTRS